jgi:hypothetical protein
LNSASSPFLSPRGVSRGVFQLSKRGFLATLETTEKDWHPSPFFVAPRRLFCHSEAYFLSSRALFCHPEPFFFVAPSPFFVLPSPLFCRPEPSGEGSLGTCVPREDMDGLAPRALFFCRPEPNFLSPRGVSRGVSQQFLPAFNKPYLFLCKVI